MLHDLPLIQPYKFDTRQSAKETLLREDSKEVIATAKYLASPAMIFTPCDELIRSLSSVSGCLLDDQMYKYPHSVISNLGKAYMVSSHLKYFFEEFSKEPSKNVLVELLGLNIWYKNGMGRVLYKDFLEVSKDYVEACIDHYFDNLKGDRQC